MEELETEPSYRRGARKAEASWLTALPTPWASRRLPLLYLALPSLARLSSLFLISSLRLLASSLSHHGAPWGDRRRRRRSLSRYNSFSVQSLTGNFLFCPSTFHLALPSSSTPPTILFPQEATRQTLDRNTPITFPPNVMEFPREKYKAPRWAGVTSWLKLHFSVSAL